MRIDAAAIAKVLQERGADDTMLQWVAATLTNQELPELVHLLGDMSDARVDDRERLVDAILLTLPANEALDNKSLQALQQIGGALGIGMRWFGARVEAELGLDDHLDLGGEGRATEEEQVDIVGRLDRPGDGVAHRDEPAVGVAGEHACEHAGDGCGAGCEPEGGGHRRQR